MKSLWLSDPISKGFMALNYDQLYIKDLTYKITTTSLPMSL